MIRHVICQLTNHSINRRRVWNDGMYFRTRCRRCDQQLVRDPAGWRPYDERTDSRHQGEPGDHSSA